MARVQIGPYLLLLESLLSLTRGVGLFVLIGPIKSDMTCIKHEPMTFQQAITIDDIGM